MPGRLSAIVLAALLGAAPARADQGPPPTPRIADLERWLGALGQHVLGNVDDPLLDPFEKWPTPAWLSLPYDVRALLLIARDQPAALGLIPGMGRGLPPRYSGEESRRLRVLACVVNESLRSLKCPETASQLAPDLLELQKRATAARQRGDRSYVLRLGVLLQTDLARGGKTRDHEAGFSYGSLGFKFDVTDGLGSGLRQYGVQWAIAYSLLDQIAPPGQPRPEPTRDSWVRDWFVATGRWMQFTSHYSMTHMNQALRLFPDDADVRFLNACQHEIHAGPVLQSAVKSIDLPLGTPTDIESKKNELRGAEIDFRRALAIRPDWTEAHLRLGRVLLQLDNATAAGTELTAALKASPDDTQEFLARLFLGAVEERRGHFDEAASLYLQATALFPSAQSPRLALSQLARRRGDRASSLATLKALFDRDAPPDPEGRSDPWWSYLSVQARDAEARLDALYKPLRKEPAR